MPLLDLTIAPEPLPSPLTPSAVAECLSPSVLLRVRDRAVSLALWRRTPRVTLHRAIAALLDHQPFSCVAEGSPTRAVRDVVAELPAARPLADDVLRLGRLFAAVTNSSAIRLRLEHVADNACSRHHVDSVHLRLLCTYAGLGTEWIDPDGRARRMTPFQVGLFKGSLGTDRAPPVLHRSPPVEHLPAFRRKRLLLCIDQTGVF
jgi:hypothetical protein